jgi:hypothetical protein
LRSSSTSSATASSRLTLGSWAIHAESELEIFWFDPASDAWGAGDRSVKCAAYRPRIHRQTESLKGSNQ